MHWKIIFGVVLIIAAALQLLTIFFTHSLSDWPFGSDIVCVAMIIIGVASIREGRKPKELMLKEQKIQPGLKTISEIKLVGLHTRTSFGNDRTFELWSSFMPRRNEIKNKVNFDFISMQVFNSSFDFKTFNPSLQFEKWATVEVSNFDEVPIGMETFIIPAGLYAVFIHKGDASTAAKTFGYIFGEWLPNSIYEIDNRPHFEILGEKYKRDSPDSEEEVLVPIKQK